MKWFWILVAVFMLGAPAAALGVPLEDHALKGAHIVLVTEFSTGDHAEQYIKGVREEAASLGLRLEVMDAKHDRKMMDRMVHDAMLRNARGIMISHGSPDDVFKGVERALKKGIPVVAFDCEIGLPDVIKLDQDDRMIARMGLDKIIEDSGGRANMVHIWVPGYAPMEKRMEVFREVMAREPGLVEVARFGQVTANTALHAEVMMMEVLQAHPQGEIDVVWATWDEFAKGAARAIIRSGRKEIRLYGIDVSNEDLAMLQDAGNPWVATVGVDPQSIGRVQVRLLAHAMTGRPTPERYSLQPVLITSDMLPQDRTITMDTLGDHVPRWGISQDLLANWILDLKKSLLRQ